MGWARGTNREGREVGYAVDAVCDRADCIARITRGVGNVCGGMHDGGDHGCGRYFCDAHLVISTTIGAYLTGFLCEDCLDRYERAVGGLVFDLADQIAHRLDALDQRTGCGLTPPQVADLPDDTDDQVAWDAILAWARCVECWNPETIAELVDRARGEVQSS